MLSSEPEEFFPLYTFEVVRHGARAPILTNKWYMDGFKQSAEMLTDMGMRQRSFLGRWLRLTQPLFSIPTLASPLMKSDEAEPTQGRPGSLQIFVDSTDFYRTI